MPPAAILAENLDAPNPLDDSGCNIPYFRFQDLLKQQEADHDPDFPNPCDGSQEIDPATPTFMHHRPAIEWKHDREEARVGTFIGDNSSTSTLGDPGCPVLRAAQQNSELGPVDNLRTDICLDCSTLGGVRPTWSNRGKEKSRC